MTRASAKSYAEREREFVAARMALAESGALLTEAIAARASTRELDERVEADTRRYRAAEKAYVKARRKAGS